MLDQENKQTQATSERVPDSRGGKYRMKSLVEQAAGCQGT